MITQQKQLPQVSAPKQWDKPTANAQVGDIIREPFAPVVQVIEKEALSNGKVWLVVKPISASYTEEWVVEPEPAELQHSSIEEAMLQPAGFAGDSVSCQLKPNPEAVAEYESGYAHGLLDASYNTQPMCEEAGCHYSAGYLNGYNSYRQPQLQPEATKRTDWRVKLDPCDPELYQIWIGDRCLSKKATSYSEGEQIAQQYAAMDELIRRQNKAVLAGYAG